jgi:hypothetical protein
VVADMSVDSEALVATLSILMICLVQSFEGAPKARVVCLCRDMFVCMYVSGCDCTM